MKREIKKHESEYYHIPKLKGNPWFIPLTFIFGLLSYFNFKLILNIWAYLDLGYVFASREEMLNYSPKLIDLVICYPLLFEYIFISLTIISLVRIFKKLIYKKDSGLLDGLIIGLILGLIIGLILGLIIGLLGGFIAGFIVGLIMGLIMGLILGLIMGLILGLILGLGTEFT